MVIASADALFACEEDSVLKLKYTKASGYCKGEWKKRKECGILNSVGLLHVCLRGLQIILFIPSGQDRGRGDYQTGREVTSP